jgi:hypothetical protein
VKASTGIVYIKGPSHPRSSPSTFSEYRRYLTLLLALSKDLIILVFLLCSPSFEVLPRYGDTLSIWLPSNMRIASRHRSSMVPTRPISSQIIFQTTSPLIRLSICTFSKLRTFLWNRALASSTNRQLPILTTSE